MKKELIAIMIIIFLVSFSPAKITLLEPEEIYNLGDKLYFSATVTSASELGSFKVNLNCKNATTIIKIPARSFPLNEEYVYSLPYKELTKLDLEIENLESITGRCNLFASMGTDSVSTKEFTITDNINLLAKFDKSNYNPGEPITLDVEATKANGKLLNGFIEGSDSYSFTNVVSDGIATEVFSLSENVEAGRYNLNLIAYDKDSNNEIQNKANQSISFMINQVPSFIDVSLSEIEINPEENFTISAEIFDQSGKQMAGTISLILVSPENIEMQKTIESGDFIEVIFETNETAGKWKINAKFEDVIEEKEFKINKYQKIEFTFLDDSIILMRNIGNTIYNKTIEILVGNSTQVIDGLKLGLNEERKFKLSAPDGNHEILISDGESKSSGTFFLTGSVISIDDLSNMGIFKNYFTLWAFLILIIIAGAIVWFIRKKKTQKTKSAPKRENHPEKKVNVIEKNSNQAESTLVLSGQKQNSSIISLKIANYNSLKENAKNELSKILSVAKAKKAMIDIKEHHILIIFTPSITKTFENEKVASKIGKKIGEDLKHYNKKFSEKIEFGIGINSGEIISMIENKKLKYSGIGNTISLAKKMSDIGQNKVLISQNLRKKIMRDVKAIKISNIGKTEIFEVEKITDKEANKEKLQDLLKRMNRN